MSKPAKVSLDTQPQNRVSVDKLVKEVNRDKGEHTMIVGRQVPSFRVTSSGIFLLDFAMYGGMPQHVITYKGGESAGKSSAAFRLIAGSQKKYPETKSLLIDTEGTFDPLWASALGVDLDRLLVVRPSTGEDALDIARGVVEKVRDVSILVIDSIASLSPSAELKNSVSDDTMAALPRMLNKFLRPLFIGLAVANREGLYPLILLTNQYRSKVGGFVMGNPDAETGGKLLRHAPIVSVDFRSKEVVPNKGEFKGIITHNDCSFTIGKSKIGSTIKSGEFSINRSSETGYAIGELLDIKTVLVYAVRMGVVAGSTRGLEIGRVKLGSSSEAVDFLHQNNDLLQYIKIKTIVAQRKKVGMVPYPPDNFILEDCSTFLPMICDKWKIKNGHDSETV